MQIILKSEPTLRKVQSLGGLNAFRLTEKQGVVGEAFQHCLEKRSISVVNSKSAPLESNTYNLNGSTWQVAHALISFGLIQPNIFQVFNSIFTLL